MLLDNYAVLYYSVTCFAALHHQMLVLFCPVDKYIK